MTTGRINQVAALIHERSVRTQGTHESPRQLPAEADNRCWIVGSSAIGKRIALRVDPIRAGTEAQLQ